MLLLWNNRADSAVLTPGSEIATLPGTNVQQPHLSRKWHTASGVKSSSLILDMGAAVSAALGALLGTNFTAAATIQWRASNVDPAVLTSLLLDTGVVNAGVKVGFGASYKSWTAVSARYWRFDHADATVPDNLQVGRVVLGPVFQPAANQNYGWTVTPIDPSDITESYGGQEYADERPQRRQVQFMLDWLSKAEAFDNALVLARANGIVRDVLAINDIADSHLSEQAVWGRLTALEPIFQRLKAHWSQKFTVRERL